MVAVGFSPRRTVPLAGVAERRLNQPIAAFKRRSATHTLRFGHRGLKPTATVSSSLREADTFGGRKKLRCAGRIRALPPFSVGHRCRGALISRGTSAALIRASPSSPAAPTSLRSSACGSGQSGSFAPPFGSVCGCAQMRLPWPIMLARFAFLVPSCLQAAFPPPPHFPGTRSVHLDSGNRINV
jgi:hypothetical protein